MANTLWAFVKLGVSAQDDVVAALLRRALDVSDVMNEQQIVNTLYAIAKLRLQVSEALREALLQQAEHVAGGMTAQNVANTLWALAEAQIVPSQAQSSALLARAERVSGGLEAKARRAGARRRRAPGPAAERVAAERHLGCVHARAPPHDTASGHHHRQRAAAAGLDAAMTAGCG